MPTDSEAESKDPEIGPGREYKESDEVSSSTSVTPGLDLALAPEATRLEEVMAASPRQWWDRSMLSEDTLAQARMIKSDKLDLLFSKDTLVKKLRQVLNFLAALGADRPPLPVASTSGSRSLATSPYPRLMVAHVWHHHISRCFSEESAHPYRVKAMRKRVYFPGAEQLIVTFDRRCCLSASGALTLTWQSLTRTGTSGKGGVGEMTTMRLFGSFGDDALMHKPLIVPGCEVLLEFDEFHRIGSHAHDSGSSCTVNDADEWGWGLVVCACGAVYESNSTRLEMDPAMIERVAEKKDSSRMIGTNSASVDSQDHSVGGKGTDRGGSVREAVTGAYVVENTNTVKVPEAELAGLKLSGDDLRRTAGTRVVDVLEESHSDTPPPASPSASSSTTTGGVVSSAAEDCERPRTRRGRLEGGPGSPASPGPVALSRPLLELSPSSVSAMGGVLRTLTPSDRLSAWDASSLRGSAGTGGSVALPLTPGSIDLRDETHRAAMGLSPKPLPLPASTAVDKVTKDAAVALPEDAAARENRLLRLVEKEGILLWEGQLAVPLASEVEVTVARPHTRKAKPQRRLVPLTALLQGDDGVAEGKVGEAESPASADLSSEVLFKWFKVRSTALRTTFLEALRKKSPDNPVIRLLNESLDVVDTTTDAASLSTTVVVRLRELHRGLVSLKTSHEARKEAKKNSNSNGNGTGAITEQQWISASASIEEVSSEVVGGGAAADAAVASQSTSKTVAAIKSTPESGNDDQARLLAAAVGSSNDAIQYELVSPTIIYVVTLMPCLPGVNEVTDPPTASEAVRLRLPEEKNAKITATIKSSSVRYRLTAMREDVATRWLQREDRRAQRSSEYDGLTLENDAEVEDLTGAPASNDDSGDKLPGNTLPPSTVEETGAGLDVLASSSTDDTESTVSAAAASSSTDTEATESAAAATAIAPEESAATAAAVAADAATAALLASEMPWNCALCTMLNAPTDKVCCVGESVRVVDTPALTAAAAGGAAISTSTTAATAATTATAAGAGVGWWCSACTYINPLLERRCAMCEHPRSGEAVDEPAAGVTEEVEEADDEEDSDQDDSEEDEDDDDEDEDEEAPASPEEATLWRPSAIPREPGASAAYVTGPSGPQTLQALVGALNRSSPAPGATADDSVVHDPLVSVTVTMGEEGVDDGALSEDDDDDVAFDDELVLPTEPAGLTALKAETSSRETKEGTVGVDEGKAASADSIKKASPLKKRRTPRASDVITLTLKGTFTPIARFNTRVEGALLSTSTRHEGQIGPNAEETGCILLPSQLQHRLASWSNEADLALLEYMSAQMQQTTGRAATAALAMFQSPELVALPKQFLTYRAACMSHLSLLDVQARVLMLDAFNKSLEELLPLINLRNPDPLSIGAMIRRCNRYVFLSLKQPLLDRMVVATTTPGGPGIPVQLSLDNMKAMNSRGKGEREPSSSQNCFVQAFRQLLGKDASVYRHVFSGDRVFQITFVSESGIDAGGVFREGVSRMVEDLFSEHFSLLVPCPNAQHEVHTNMDKFVPNPQHSDSLTMQMFEFIGKLMGMSLRVKLCLPFEFPSIIWKKLVGEEVCLDDLMAMDAITCRLLEAVRSCESDGIIDEESFEVKYGGKLRFVYTGSDGVERELGRGLRGRVVTFDERISFCDLVQHARLHEFDKHAAAIERGMAEVVPMRLLQLFSWQQLETLVSGSPTFDLDLWRSKTEVQGVSAKTVKLFWDVMGSLTPKEQSGFVRFAWGRSRLPPAKEFTTKMKLTVGR